ncbi:hypothetical protein ABZ789_05720, partial [Rhodococcus sp. NPDC047139]
LPRIEPVRQTGLTEPAHLSTGRTAHLSTGPDSTILVDIPPAESRQGSATQSGFADATRWSLFVAAAFLTAGLVTATQLQPAKRPGG